MLSQNLRLLYARLFSRCVLRSSTGWRQPGKPSVSGVSNPIDRQGFRVERRKGSGACAYQLVQIPSADAHVAAVLVHALGELLRRAGAVVAPAAVLLGRGGRCLDGLGRGAGTAEEPADGVADGGSYRDTAVVACR